MFGFLQILTLDCRFQNEREMCKIIRLRMRRFRNTRCSKINNFKFQNYKILAIIGTRNRKIPMHYR